MANFARGGTQLCKGRLPGFTALHQVAAATGHQQQAEQFERGPALGIRGVAQYCASAVGRYAAQGVLQLLQALPGAAVFRVSGLPAGKRLALLALELAAPLQHQPLAGLLDNRRGDGRVALHSSYTTW